MSSIGMGLNIRFVIIPMHSEWSDFGNRSERTVKEIMKMFSRTWAFCFSKLPELIDTVFIVLRKQPLIFLHWYHHASVLVYCWFSYQDYSSTGR